MRDFTTTKTPNLRGIGTMVGAGVLGLVFLVGGCSSMTSVDAGSVGLYSKFGEIENDTADPGLHFVNPFTTKIEKMDVQTKRMNGKTPVYTSDLQTGEVAFALNYSLKREAAANMRRTVGHEWADRLIPPVVESAIKSVFGKTSAAAAIANRQVMQTSIESVVRTHLAKRGINVESLSLTNVDYSKAFTDAVEEAQVATQQAIAAKNATVRIQEEANQKVITAESEAKAIQLRAQALAQNPALVQYKLAEKWDGKLPENMYGGGAMPFINVAPK